MWSFAGVAVATGVTLLASAAATSAQSVPSTTGAEGSATTMIVETTAPQTTAPPEETTAPGPVEADAIGPLCHVFTPQPARGDPVVTQVILTSNGEVVATRTGGGPYVPQDFNTRCTPAPAPATPVSGTSSYTG